MKYKCTFFSKNFLLMAAGQIISLFGNQILRFALPLFLLQQTGSSAIFGTISAISFLPMILLFPIGGLIADRFNKRNIMVILDFSTSALVFFFMRMVRPDQIVPWIAATMLILYAIQGAYQPAVQASIPALVRGDHIIQANAVIDMISSLANMIGPVLGGLVYATVGLSPILHISTVCFFASAVMELFLHIPFQKRQGHQNILHSGIQEMLESIRFFIDTKPILLKIAIIYGMLSLLLCSLFNIALPVLFTQKLGFSKSMANMLYGYSQGAIAIGSVLGGLLAGILSKRLKTHFIPYYIIGCALCIFTGGITLGISRSSMTIYLILTLGCSMLMVLSTLFQIQMMSYVQLLTPKELIGKVVSCVICICMCSNPIGQWIYGILFDQIGQYSYIPFLAASFLGVILGMVSRKCFCNLELEIEKIHTSQS